MKKYCVAIVLFFISHGMAVGSPYLVCAPYPAGLDQNTMPVSFIVTGLSSTPLSTPATTNQDGTIQLHYDLSQLAHGSYTVSVTAQNVFGGISAASSPFSFVSGVPAAPTSLRIVP